MAVILSHPQYVNTMILVLQGTIDQTSNYNVTNVSVDDTLQNIKGPDSK